MPTQVGINPNHLIIFFSDSTGDIGQFLKEVLFPAAAAFFLNKICFTSANRKFFRTIERTPQTIRRSDNFTQVRFNDSVAKETSPVLTTLHGNRCSRLFSFLLAKFTAVKTYMSKVQCLNKMIARRKH